MECICLLARSCQRGGAIDESRLDTSARNESSGLANMSSTNHLNEAELALYFTAMRRIAHYLKREQGTSPTDLQIVDAMRLENLNGASVMQFGTLMTVVVDQNAELIACGYPEREYAILVERRPNGRVTPHLVPNGVSSGVRHLFPVIGLMNASRAWSEDTSMLNMLSTVGRWG